ncbi:MAG: hypothetical protein O2800_06740 [Planctomycetota bacterium]|nr:hypothetical protein [Planctomycetota bacterium]
MTELPTDSTTPGELPRGDGLQRRLDAPRRVSHGMRLKHRQGATSLHAHASRWIDAVEHSFSLDARADGMEYAIGGQVVTMRIESGAVRCGVQGRASRPYQTWIRPVSWTAAEWDRAIVAMASEAAYTARLVNGELPAATPILMEKLQLNLWPAAEGSDIAVECSCGSDRCKHAWAVVCHLAERINDDPLILFALRGLASDRVLERLRERRQLASQGVSVAHPAHPIAHDPPELASPESMLHDYWRPGRSLETAQSLRCSSHISHALLRRMGQSPMGGRFPVVGLLASVYDSVRNAALAARERA